MCGEGYLQYDEIWGAVLLKEIHIISDIQSFLKTISFQKEKLL